MRSYIAAGFFFVLAFSISHWVDTLWGQQEDAYITYQYAHRLASGEGFTFSPGTQPSLGTTTPLWTLILTLGDKLGSSPHLIAPWLTSICYGATAALLLLLGEVLVGLWVGVPTALTWSLCFSIFFRGGGMETALLMFLSTLTFFGVVKRWRSGVIGTCCGLLALTRLDALLLVAALLTAQWMKERSWRKLLLITGIALLVNLPWLIYAHLTFGHILSDSLKAKLATPDIYPPLSQSIFIFTYLRLKQGVLIFWLWVLLTTFGSFYAIRHRTYLLPVVAWVPAYFLVLKLVKAADFAWYYLPPLWLSLLLAFHGIYTLLNRYNRYLLCISIACFSFIIVLGNWNGIVILRVHPPDLGTHKTLALLIKDLSQPGDLVAATEVGNLAYWSERPVLDLCALTCPEVLPYTSKQNYTPLIEQKKPRFLMLRGMSGFDQEQLHKYYRPVASHLYWGPEDYLVWERKRVHEQ